MTSDGCGGLAESLEDVREARMAIRDFTSQRLFVDAALAPGVRVALDTAQASYLTTVLRMKPGQQILVFNGRDGEWRARTEATGRRDTGLVVEEQVRAQEGGPDLWYLFAPLKRARLDYMVQKAVEMGVSRLSPVLTRHTVAERVNIERMQANAIEAAEQCGILRVPGIDDPRKLERAIADWPADRALVFCDEAAPIASPVEAIARALGAAAAGGVCRLGLLIGPEGGFASDERDLVAGHPQVIRISLGPRILRADTAAVAALAVLLAAAGDWRQRRTGVTSHAGWLGP